LGNPQEIFYVIINPLSINHNNMEEEVKVEEEVVVETDTVEE